jgi:copper chaperone CopZ
VLAHTPGVCLVDLDISSATIVVEFDTKRVEEDDIAALLSGPSMPAAEPL